MGELDDDYHFAFKIAIGGDTGVGKSSLLSMFAGDEPPSEARLFNQDPKGVRLKLIMQEDRDLTYRVQFLELPGSLRHRKVVTGMSADAVGAVIVFDGETNPPNALQALCFAYPEQCSLCLSSLTSFFFFLLLL